MCVYIAGCLEWKSRLVNGSTPNEGRLEICYNNTWRTICENHWTDAYAEIACRQLGYSTIGIRYNTLITVYDLHHNAGAVYRRNAYFGAGNGLILPHYLKCRGNESSLADCKRFNHRDTCTDTWGRALGVICQDIGIMKKYYAPCTVMSS